MAQRSAAVLSLVELGFSQYEARAYVGLLGRDPTTGYALANLTGIPQPKVYETLRRLAAKGVVAAVGGDPARFVAVPAGELLDALRDSFRSRLAGAERELAREAVGSDGDWLRAFRSSTSWAAIEEQAVRMIDGAGRHVYVSINCPEPTAVAAAIMRADDRRVASDVLHFGDPVVRPRHGRTFGHYSTRGVVYRRHQARHLAIATDRTDVLWAVAQDGTHWQSLAGRDQLLAALAKGYIRHDIYVQQIWTDFHEQLQRRYGPGMQQLVGELSGTPGAEQRPARSGQTGRLA